MALLNETRDRLKDIQNTNHEILQELGKLEEKQFRRRERLLNSQTDTPTTKEEAGKAEMRVEAAERHVELEDRSTAQQTQAGQTNKSNERTTAKLGVQPERVKPFALTSEMTDYLRLLRRKKVPECQDNRLCERFGIHPKRGSITRPRAGKAGPQKKVQHLTLPEKPKSGDQRSTTQSQDAEALIKAKPGVSQADPRLVPATLTPEQMMQKLAGGWTMALNPLTGQMQSVSQDDLPNLIQQSRAAEQPLVALAFDPRDLCLKIAYGRDTIQDIVDVLCDENLAEVDEETRNLLSANRKVMQLFAESDSVPFGAYMQILGEVVKTKGMDDLLKLSTEATLTALQDPSRCHQVAVVGPQGRPALEMSGRGEPETKKPQQKALPPAAENQKSKPPASASKDHKPRAIAKANRASRSHHMKPSSSMSSSPNVPPQRPGALSSQQKTTTSQGADGAVASSSDNQGAGAMSGPQQTSVGAYIHAGPAERRSSPMPEGVPYSGSTRPATVQPTSKEPAKEEDGAAPVYIDEHTWSAIAKQELEQGATARSIRERGMDTIICLDLSESMKGEPWKQATAFIKGFIEGIQNTTLMDDVYEHVGLVTFGSETKVQQHMTCDYVEVVRKLAKLSPGGPSPLWAGITMVYAALRGAGAVFVSNGYKFHPRVFLLSDGRPTPSNMIAGPDSCPKAQLDVEKVKVAKVVATMHKEIPITMNAVPLGDFDSVLLEQLANLTGGKVVSPEDWQSHTRTFRNYHAASKVGSMMQLANPSLAQLLLESMGNHSTQDRLEMEEFLKTHKPDGMEDSSSDSEDLPQYPSLGSRIKRNVAIYKTGSPEKVGTVTKHFTDGHVGVTWDQPDDDGRDREKIEYMSSSKGVLSCDEPRVLKDELIAVGCRVRRGNDWHYADQDGGAGSLGSVYSVDSQGIVKVRWDNGHKNSYRFGQDGVFFDVEIVEVQRKVEKKAEQEKDPAEIIEEMNRRNKANSRSIMDSVPRAASESRPKSAAKADPAGQSETDNGRKVDSGEIDSVKHDMLDRGDTGEHKASERDGSASGSELESSAMGARPKAMLSPEKSKEIIRLRGYETFEVESENILKPLIVKWCWNKDGTWQVYPQEVCSRIETSFRRNPKGTALVKVGEKQFRIVFARMEQVDIETRDKFPVCRK